MVPSLAADYACLSANYVRELGESARLRQHIMELQQQLDDAHAVIAAQGEVLVRLQHRDQRHNTR